MYPGGNNNNPYGQAGGQQPPQYGVPPTGYYGAPVGGGIPQSIPQGIPTGIPQTMPPGVGVGGGGGPAGGAAYQGPYVDPKMGAGGAGYQAPMGQAPYGQAPYGQAPYGQAPYGQQSYPPQYQMPGTGGPVKPEIGGGYQQQPPVGFKPDYPQQQQAPPMYQQVQPPQGFEGAAAGKVQSGMVDTKNPNLLYNKVMVWFQFNSTRVMAFDLRTKQWQNMPNHSNYKFNEYFRVTQLPDFSCLLTGGSNSQGKNTNSVILYHGGNITAKRGMLMPRRAHSAIYFNNFVYVFGGLNEKGFLYACERYSPMADTWENIAQMSVARTLTSVCAFNNDSIFIFGGFNETLNKELDVIERYDIPTGKMNVCAYKMVNRLQNPLVVQVNDQEILLVGGFNDDIGDSSEVYLINVFKGEFTPKTGINDQGWSVYPPIYYNDTFYYFMTGEDDKVPDAIEHRL